MQGFMSIFRTLFVKDSASLGRQTPKRETGKQSMPALPAGLKDYVRWDSSFKKLSFGDIARDSGFLSSAQLETLLSHKLANDHKVGELAMSLGFMTPEQVRKVLSHQTLKIYVDDRYLSSPLYTTWLFDLKSSGIVPVTVSVDAKDLAGLADQNIGSSTDFADDRSLVTLTEARELVMACAKIRGSDLHFLVREKHAEVQLRVKGELKIVKSMTSREGTSLVMSIYNGLAGQKESMYQPHETQDAQIAGDVLPGSSLSSIRIIRGPCYGGHFMVARLQYSNSASDVNSEPQQSTYAVGLTKKTPSAPTGNMRLQNMGYSKRQIALLSDMVRMSSGIVLVTGPTGSGKTTTIYELMAHQARIYPGTRQITVENPVEYPMPWAIQMPVMAAKDDSESGDEYLKMIRTSLRMDPDIILCGELRGAKESLAAIQGAQTGHLVWTTLHVTDPYLAINRLETMDRVNLARSVICDHKLIRGIISQRLVPILCPDCKIPVTKKNATEKLNGDTFSYIHAWHDHFTKRGEDGIGNAPTIFVRGEGCNHCNDDGIIGAQAVAEVVLTDHDLMYSMINETTDDARKKHRKKENSDHSMLGNAMLHVCNGILDPNDVERAIDLIVTPEME